jgi:hypothetical protein
MNWSESARGGRGDEKALGISRRIAKLTSVWSMI